MSEGHTPLTTHRASPPAKPGARRSAPAWGALGCALGLMSGCATTLSDIDETRRGPLEVTTALTRAQRGVARSVADGDATQQTFVYQSSVAYRARLNPAPCDCPALEIFIAGRWERVFLLDAETGDLIDPLDTSPADGDAVFAINVQLVEQRINANNKLNYRAVIMRTSPTP